MKENNNPKVFIATGTGLAPIYRMMMASPKAEKQLYISVATKSDVFYREELEAIPNLQVNYFVSRECVEGFCEGRMDIDTMQIDTNAEVYLCGNPKMIADFVPKLKEKWLAGVYYEEFL